MSNIEKLRQQFPILKQQVHGHELIYFDNAATSQKPEDVLNAVQNYYIQDNANVHRGLHELSIRASDLYDGCREKLANYINAYNSQEVVFTSGATESLNLVARCFVEKIFKKGDAIIISELEHHSNIVPWQILRNKLGLEIRWLSVNEKGEVEVDKLLSLLQDGKVKFASFCWVSNSLGSINPVEQMIEMCHRYDVPVMLDACQVPAHQRIDVQQLGCDLLVLSGHKMFAPTGVGILWARHTLLEQFDYWQGGGDMIIEVGFDDFVPSDVPIRFEAGTPAIAQVVGLGAAVDWLETVDLVETAKHEAKLLEIATAGLRDIPNCRIVGEAEHKSAVVSFCLYDNVLHSSDLATLLNLRGIAVRSGHHCTMPILKKMGAETTARASFCFYNTEQEVVEFVKQLAAIIKKFGNS